MMLDAFLLAMAAIGITGHAAVLIVPNMAIKILLLLIMLFIGCVSIDTFHAHYIKEAVGIVGEAEVRTSPSCSRSSSLLFSPKGSSKRFLSKTYLKFGRRLFFCAWYRIAFGNNEGDVKDFERRPPSYAYCISHSTPSMCISTDELPSYEEAVRRTSVQKQSHSSAPLPRSAQLPCCSTSKPPLPTTTTASSSSRRGPRMMKASAFRYHAHTPSQTTRTSTTTSAGVPKPHRSSRPQRTVAIQIEYPENAPHQCEFCSVY
ncbi:hypothetical protein COOONC_15667 [Cooperia oncophora]